MLRATSAAIALVLEDHEANAATVATVHGRRLGLAGHAWFETYSVLTRLPGDLRHSPAAAERLVAMSRQRSRGEATLNSLTTPDAGTTP